MPEKNKKQKDSIIIIFSIFCFCVIAFYVLILIQWDKCKKDRDEWEHQFDLQKNFTEMLRENCNNLYDDYWLLIEENCRLSMEIDKDRCNILDSPYCFCFKYDWYRDYFGYINTTKGFKKEETKKEVPAITEIEGGKLREEEGEFIIITGKE